MLTMYSLWEYFSSVDARLCFGVGAGLLSTIAFVPYILDTLAKRTRPQRASWLIWSVLGSIALGSQIYEGATSSLWFAGVQVAGTVIILLLSIRRGSGTFLSNTDFGILAAAGVGLVLWYFTETAAYALAITISISLLGGLATAVKAFYAPHSETLSTWVISFIASIFAVLSVGKADLILLAYPVYLLVLYLAFIIAILLGRVRRAAATLMPGTIYFIRPMRAALRTTADGIIVVAALVYLLNNGLPLRAQTPAPVHLLSDMKQSTLVDSLSMRQSTSAMALSTTTTSAPFEAAHEPAVHSDELPDLGLTALTRNTAFGNLPHYPDVPRKDMFGKRRDISLNEHHYQTIAAPFLQLDRDDPFASLVVSVRVASLITDVQAPRPTGLIPQGAKLTILATNGDWFHIATDAGQKGFLHRSQVSVANPETS